MYNEQRKADGVLAIYNAQSGGIEKLIMTFGNDPKALNQYLMIDRGIIENIAKANANAVKDMKPKIVQWNTSNSDKNAITDIFKTLPVIIDTISDQTGMKPPSWLVDMNNKTDINKE